VLGSPCAFAEYVRKHDPCDLSAQVTALRKAVCKTALLDETRSRLAQAAIVLWTVAGQLADECRRSADGGQRGSSRCL